MPPLLLGVLSVGQSSKSGQTSSWFLFHSSAVRSLSLIQPYKGITRFLLNAT